MSDSSGETNIHSFPDWLLTASFSPLKRRQDLVQRFRGCFHCSMATELITSWTMRCMGPPCRSFTDSAVQCWVWRGAAKRLLDENANTAQFHIAVVLVEQG